MDGGQLYYVAGAILHHGLPHDVETLFEGPDGVDYVGMALDEASYYILVNNGTTGESSIERAPGAEEHRRKWSTFPTGLLAVSSWTAARPTSSWGTISRPGSRELRSTGRA